MGRSPAVPVRSRAEAYGRRRFHRTSLHAGRSARADGARRFAATGDDGLPHPALARNAQNSLRRQALRRDRRGRLTDAADRRSRRLRAHGAMASSTTCCAIPSSRFSSSSRNPSGGSSRRELTGCVEEKGSEWRRGRRRRRRRSFRLQAEDRSDSAYREDLIEAVGGARNDVDADELADASRRRCTSVGRGFDRRDVTPDDRRHEPGVDLLPARQTPRWPP